MIVGKKKNIQLDEVGYVSDEHAYLVMCVEERPDGTWYYIYNDSDMSVPYARGAGIFDVYDSHIPREWIKVESTRGIVQSFPEWANNKDFYHYLLEDEWQPDKTKWAKELLWKKYQDYLSDYAIKKFGSIDEFKKQLVDVLYDNALAKARSHGLEKPDRDEIAVRIRNSPLNLDDLLVLRGEDRELEN